MKTRKIFQIVLAALALLLIAGQGAWAATVTWTVKGGNNNSPAAFYAQFTDGSTLTSQVNWTYDIDAQISFNLRSNLTLTLTNSSKHLLVSEATYIGGRGSTTLTLSSPDYYIYRVRLLDSNGNVIQLDANGNAVNHGGVSQCDYWNMAKSFSHTYANGILFSKIEISYGTYIPITDAVISGLNSQYTVSNVPVTPVPTVTWHGNTLTKGTHYYLTYQNNAAAGTATVNVVGSGMFNSQVSANYDLVWAAYSVHFNANGGTGNMDDEPFTYGETKALTANAFTREYHDFAGWSTTANGDVVYTDGQEVSNLTVTNGATIDLYAKWTVHTYTVHFDANGGTGNMDDEQFAYGEAKALTANGFAREGYTFAGWSTTANGAVVYTDGQEVSNLTTTNGATIDLYAQWTINTYVVHFNANGGTGNMDDEPFTYGETKALTANGFAREGYTFAGWSTTTNGDVVYADGQEVSNLTTTNGATIDLYAKWTAHTYTVHFDANGGTGEMSNEQFTYGETKALTANAFTREYHDFAGWSATTNGDVVYADGQEVSNLTTTNGATVTLYAKWTEVSPVSYIDADGTEKSAMAMPITESQTEYGTVGGTNWYVVSGEVNLSKLRFWDDETLLILEDGARLTINLSEEFADGALHAYNNITIYGQSNGTGQLIVNASSFDFGSSLGIEAHNIIINSGNIFITAKSYGIYTKSGITINGGSVTATGFDDNGSGLYAENGSITINGGSVTASGRYAIEGCGLHARSGSIAIIGGSVKTSTSLGIRSERNITITGGDVEASGTYYGIYAQASGNGGNITIDGGNVKASSTGSDGRGIYAGTITISRGIVEANGGNCGINGNTIWLAGGTVTASKYRGTIRIPSKYTDGTAIYTGRLSDDQIAAIAGKTMTPYVAPSPDLTLVQGTKDGVTAYWGTFYDSGFGYTLPAGAAAYTMDAKYHLYRLGTDGSVIPKGTAVVIISDKPDVFLDPDLLGNAQATDNAPGGNILVGRDVATEIDGICVLSVSASGAVGFYPLSGIALPAHKAGYVPKDGLKDYHKEDGQQW